MRRIHRTPGAVAVLTLAGLAASAHAVLTPEQKAGANGQIANPSAQEYYLGPINAGDSTSGDIIGAVGGTLPSLAWYKYVSNGSTPVVFDMFGSVFGFGGGGVFTGGPDGELALYDVNGHFVAGNESVRAPANGESNVRAVVPPGAPPAPVNYRQPRDPTRPVYEYSSSQNTWFARNNQGLSQLGFVPAPQANPLWNPANPNYTPNADWNQYAVLPAGTYFLAVTGFSTYFAGNPRDVATAGNDTDNPFGFVSYHAQTGTYVLNARRAGDLNLDATLNSDDVRALIAKIRSLASQRGIAPEGFSAGQWNALPADISDPGNELQRFDLTGNSRIDLYDVGALGRFSGLAVPTFSQWAISDGGNWSSAAPANWSGNGVPNGVDHAASFGTFDGTIVAPQTVNLAQSVTLGAINFDNNAAYTIAAAPGASITLHVSLSPDAQINVFAGSHTIAARILATSDTTINVAQAGSTLAISGDFSAPGHALTKTGPGTAVLANVRAGTALAVNEGTLRISTKATSNSPAGTSTVNAITITTGAQLDLTNNSMVIDYASSVETLIGDVRGVLQDGRLASSLSDSSHRLGYGDNAALHKSSFAGQTVDASSVLIKYTFAGDSNLDGQVDVTDLGALATNWQTSSVWTGGDFNYDGFVDVSDLGILATNWQAGVGSPLGPGSLEAALMSVGLSLGSVPEPAAASLLCLTLLLRRQREHRLAPSQPSH